MRSLSPVVCNWRATQSLPDYLAERGIVVSCGHSDATAEQAGRAFDRGVATVTHLFNAMRPLGHRDPGLAAADPHGRGWVLKVKAPNLADNLRNLLSGRLARKWMEDSREALELRLMALSGSVLQDGGEPTADFARHLPPEDWKRLVGEFFLT